MVVSRWFSCLALASGELVVQKKHFDIVVTGSSSLWMVPNEETDRANRLVKREALVSRTPDERVRPAKQSLNFC